MNAFLLPDLLRKTAADMPDRTAVVFQDRQLSYAELDTASDRVAAYLIERGVAIGDRVGLFVNKSLEALVSIFGIMKAGAAYVPIDPQVPASRARYIIETCGIRHLISSENHLHKLLSDNRENALPLESIILIGNKTGLLNEIAEHPGIIPIGTVLGRPGSPPKPVHMADVNPAYILFTSGSTGDPKGVVISHLNALSFVNMASEYFEITQEDRLGNQAPLHFDLSVFDIYVAVKRGAVIVLIPEYLSAFPVRLAEYIFDKKISIWNSAASVLVQLAIKGRLDRFRFGDIRIVHFSGDVMPVKYLKVLKMRMPKAAFYNIYGQTEANSSLCYHVEKIPDSGESAIPIGRPFPNFEVFALTEDNRMVSGPAEEGELYVKGSTVALGYWRDPGLTKEKFVPDPRNPFAQCRTYKTGDIIKIGEDGNYYFVGRKDNMVKSRGYRIELGEIEKVIINHPVVTHAAAVPIPDEKVGSRIVAYVALKEGRVMQVEEMVSYCALHLPTYMIPEFIEFRDSLPVTSSGKIDRQCLAKEARMMYARRSKLNG
jgi:amino acid adenylation domain-containing protein